jgi:hypothetical protein
MTRAALFTLAGLFVASPALAQYDEDADSTASAEPTSQSGWFAGHRGISAKFEADAAFRRVWDVPVYGGDFAVSLGAQTRAGGFYGTFSGLIGETNYGLEARQYALGASWEAPIERVHLGLLLHTTLFGISRATTDHSMYDVGGGAFGFASCDLAAQEHTAIYVALKAGGDVFSGSGEMPVLWGASAGLGLRLFRGRTRGATARSGSATGKSD